MIIRCKIYFVLFIFVVYAYQENIFTTKNSRSTVYQGCSSFLAKLWMNLDKKKQWLHEWICQYFLINNYNIFFMSRRWVKMQPTSAITAICTCNKIFTTAASCLFSHKISVTFRSNVLILIKAHVVARILRSPRAPAITPMRYCVILHGTGIGKNCCRNTNWIINPDTRYDGVSSRQC